MHLVGSYAVSHHPFCLQMTRGPREQWAAIVEQTAQQVELLRQQVADARPDTLLVVGHDHLNQLFMNNMPAFLLGKMETYDGTVDHEVRMYGLPPCVVPGDAALVRDLLEGGLDRGIDFAYSDELVLEQSIVVPLLMLRPAMDLPIVPLLSKCMAPPVPRARRFLEVGQGCARHWMRLAAPSASRRSPADTPLARDRWPHPTPARRG